MKNFLLLGALVLAAGCGERATTNVAAPDETPQPTPGAAPSTEPMPAPTAAPTATPADRGRLSRYTSLADCKLIREKPQEAGFAESRCPGVGGYGLRLIDADARQNLFVEQPGGSDTSLRLSELSGGGFSAIGKSIEWRGAAKGAELTPDAIILRYNVVENPTSPGSETAYLIVVSLANGTPCVTDRIAPGPRQNERAHAAADDANHACLA